MNTQAFAQLSQLLVPRRLHIFTPSHQVGHALYRFLPSSFAPGQVHVRDLFKASWSVPLAHDLLFPCIIMAFTPLQIRVPYLEWDKEAVEMFAELQGTCCVLRTVTGLELKGGLNMTMLPNGERGILFTGSPRVADLTELKVIH